MQNGLLFSMNGFRHQLNGDVKELRAIAQAVIAGDEYDPDDFRRVVNDVITHSNVINCVYEEDNQSFSDMSDLEVAHLDEDEQEDC